ncbi:hypothetical protein [Rubrivivax rivuli]|uniref:Uncharacterized protein n=1 Tax=Rubrivivax rivuli TaxID=1862385 RepID=A0A437RCP1_9BURK|nr:hypothetical protein [Rubrivivax rivuli]RVU44529.1 hypothetical protein EOE66_17860 [Rubrivivax rivuli]
MRMAVWMALVWVVPGWVGAQAFEAPPPPQPASLPAELAMGDAAALRKVFEQAVWPSDIVRAADAYLRLHPGASDVVAQRAAAAEVMQLLRAKDVLVFRSSFTEAGPALQRDLRLAALGDRAAAVRLAEASRAHDEAHGTRRYVGWMQLAALLRDPEASYQLALHYRRTGQPALAARYETLASDLGHIPLPSLDNSRK